MLLSRKNQEENPKSYETDADCENPRVIRGGSYGMRSEALTKLAWMSVFRSNKIVLLIMWPKFFPGRWCLNQNRCLKMLLCFVKSGPCDSYIDLEGILKTGVLHRSIGNRINSLEDMPWALIPAFCLIKAIVGSGFHKDLDYSVTSYV